MRIGWRGALGFALSAGLLWWTFKDIPFAEVRSGLAHANLGLRFRRAIDLDANTVTADRVAPHGRLLDRFHVGPRHVFRSIADPRFGAQRGYI